MELIKLTHISKFYVTKTQTKEVLNDVNLSFPNKGMIFLLGKSGCGKSTLLNIIGGIDKASKGYVRFYPFKRNINFRFTPISYIFQNYHLLENETSLFNVMVALLIKGEPFSKAKKKATNILKSFGFTNELLNKKTGLLSGGEKERVAICRSLIIEPLAILADEPTGALDKKNSLLTFKTLKEESSKRLVIVVTHNEKMAIKYADRILKLSDGKVIDDQTKNVIEDQEVLPKQTMTVNDKWTNTLIRHNFKRRFGRNIICILSMCVSLVFSFIMIGFSSNYKKAIDGESKRHLDYGFSTISKEVKRDIENSSISLIKAYRPDVELMDELIDAFPEFTYGLSYDCLLSNYSIEYKNKTEDLACSFVYDFDEMHIDKDLLINGDMPNNGSEILINRKAFDSLKTESNCIGEYLSFSFDYDFIFYSLNNGEIADSIHKNIDFKITGIVDELDFLSTPKIYISYLSFDQIMNDIILQNYSKYKQELYTVKRLIIESGNNDKNSSYNYYLFLNNYSKIDSIEEIKNFYQNDLVITNDSLKIKEAMDSLIYAADIGGRIFFIIITSGTLLIIAIFSFAAYSEDKKISAILFCLGAKNNQILSIFCSESVACSLISFALSLIISLLIEKPLNVLIYKYIGLDNLIDIPFKSFLGVKYFLPFFVLIILLAASVFSSLIPMMVSRNISLKDELRDI